jgi:hypothetical protein
MLDLDLRMEDAMRDVVQKIRQQPRATKLALLPPPAEAAADRFIVQRTKTLDEFTQMMRG